ncbi:MAG: hypothetical protein GTO02_08815 [Candidatus Dadabacteria bacterium]|nr:hypothetical protein [Candidatus Dadabacteria bacterium]
MKYINFWTLKKREKLMLKVINWAQKNKKRVESLTKEDVKIALREN